MLLLLNVNVSKDPPTRFKLSGTVMNLFPDKSMYLKYIRLLKVAMGMLSISVYDKSRVWKESVRLIRARFHFRYEPVS